MQRKGSAGWAVMQRRPPRRALMRLASHAGAAAAVCGLVWLIFATEPAILHSGESNPAARAPTFAVFVAVTTVLLALLPVTRRPSMAVNHYGMVVRPGAIRTMLLPWAHVEEVTAMTVPGRGAGDAYLLIAVDGYCGRTAGDRPRFLDQAVLREANRATEGRVGDFDLAIRLADFDGQPEVILDRIAGYASEHVEIVNELDKAEKQQQKK